LSAPRRTIAIFLGLFIVPGVAQSVLLTVVPLEALRLLGTDRAVTLLYLAAGLAALSIPLLVQQIQLRFVFSPGASLLVVSVALLASGGRTTFACGLAIHAYRVKAVYRSLFQLVRDIVVRQMRALRIAQQ
jgi:hypothetical protein